ncbi:MAG: hypothetical protein ACR2N0_08265 [Rubrobacteraceae bacterium]|jgi:hypothetical protein|nr:hypothetical protein [Rubrobacter sp.]
MAQSKLVRLGGAAAMGSGVLLVAGELMYFVVGLGESMEGSAATLSSPSSIFQSALFLLAGVLLVGAVISVYSRHAASAGILGTAGFLMAFVGTILVAGTFWDGTFITPALAADAPELLEAAPPALVMLGFNLSFALFSVGWLLLGLAMLRTRAYPRPVAAMLMLGAILAFIPMPFTFIPFGLTVAWMSLTSLSPKNTPLEEPAHATP